MVMNHKVHLLLCNLKTISSHSGRNNSFVFQVVSTLSELLKLNFRNKTLKLYILAALGEFLYLISFQVVFTL